jgi:hypothetical protein
MQIADALRWLGEGERLAWKSLCAGTLRRAGLRSAIGAFSRPLTAPSRYPEYEQFFGLLSSAVDLADPTVWLLDIGSPKLFSLLLASRTRATVVATDIWPPAIAEAEALRGGLPPAAAARIHFGVMDAREPVPAEVRPPNGLFAGAFAMSVIEHIEPDPGGDALALCRMAEEVRPRGCVVVSVPTAQETRSEYLASEIYGRNPASERGAFFQRVYGAAALCALCAAAPSLALLVCVLIEWPDHPLFHLERQLKPRFPAAIGLLGASYPLLANRFVVTTPSPTIPEKIRAEGDAILVFTRL